MGFPFTDISIYLPTQYEVGSHLYNEESSLVNFVCDFYHQMMYGYKPPGTSRVTIQPAFHKEWKTNQRNGSIVHTAPLFVYEDFIKLDQNEKHCCILDLIQTAMLEVCNDYNWDRSVFEMAYNEVLQRNFVFEINFPGKHTRDRKRNASVCIRKTLRHTALFAEINSEEKFEKVQLIQKQNTGSYDCIYHLAKLSKWRDADRFGIVDPKKGIEIWYSIKDKKLYSFINGKKVDRINFQHYYLFG